LKIYINEIITLHICYKYLRIIVNAPWYVTNGTLHHDLNVPYVRDEIKKLSRRYADRLEKYLNILAIEVFLTSDAETRRLKRKLPQLLVYLAIKYYKVIYATGHILFKTCTNCQTYY